jgi:hypothetical protein
VTNRAETTPFWPVAKVAGLLQLKGHKSVGGMRASIYNAMPLEGVQALVGYMRDFRGFNTPERRLFSFQPSKPWPKLFPNCVSRSTLLTWICLPCSTSRAPGT